VAEIENQQHNNSSVNAIYSYGEQHIKNRLEMYNRLETRIFGILTFSGLAMTIVGSLPIIQKRSGIPSCIPFLSLAIKLVTLTIIIISIIILINEVRFNLRGKIPSLDDINKVEGIFENSEERFKRSIFLKWMKVEDDIKNAMNKRGNAINNSLVLLAIAGSLYVINISGTAILSYLQLA